ncbi:MAG: ATP-binding protein [Micrococcales bacterium]|nr:ATP-binding protein [Micrococcales bacterium]
MEILPRPAEMFDRDREWAALCAFAQDTSPGASLGIVSGRRRQGKTFLLRALCQAAGGFYFAADEAADAESLHRMGAALGNHTGTPAPLALTGWADVLDALLALGRDHPVPVVIDEFPYLVAANPSLPSIVQNALAPLRDERDQSRTRLLLCGSAVSFMGKLLAGAAPLRGRAALELVVPTLDHQRAAQFWGVGDPVTALKVNAIVGGTPAYRRELVRDDVPDGPNDFDAWVLRTVLSPTSPLFREARYLLADEPGLRDTALYHSLLAAIASGNTTRGRIASFLGRKSGDLAHPLRVLEDCGLIMCEPDAFRDNRTTFRIAEPLITFHHAVMRPVWADLEHTRDPSRLWQAAQTRYVSNVLGPHTEHIARYWLRHLAPQGVLGELPAAVESGTVNDPAARTTHEVDIVATAYADNGPRRILAIGEVKWGETIGHPHLDRLRHIRALLAAQGRPGAAGCRLVLASMTGFTDDITKHARRTDDVVLVHAADLYL